ncbi:MAG: molybdenum cofactor guanylyltransferase [Desulfobacterales bacterium]|nr:MAG: molybdenum cofactor guanylyltransferase [Desulfobacterales bacterium]
MNFPCSGVILAGGLNTRLGGRDKAFIRVGGKRLLDRIYEVFSELFEEIILVTNSPHQFLEWDLIIVTDLFAVRSSLTGIHAGLFYASNPYAFFTACDTPFLQKAVVKTVIEGIEKQVDIVMPETAAGREPLCAVYSKHCLLAAERHLRRNQLKIQRVFRKHRIKKIPEKILRMQDPELLSFYNINTPEDLARAEAMVP